MEATASPTPEETRQSNTAEPEIEEEKKEEEQQQPSSAIPGAPEPVNAFLGLMQSTVTSVYNTAATAAANVDTNDAADKAKETLASGASYAKDTMSAGADVAM